ncbi:MAG: MaoC family dehydratase N-terminal domain-containing protein, partial [Propionibacteriaceae bacterium]|nr:MaoC family dehydratase N-terminal domain-containing protein [Propionibacteriaceae bacterium]
FVWARPLRAGDEVTAQLTIDQVRVRGPIAFVTIAVRLATTEGEDVCTATSTLMHKAVAA